MRSLLLSLALTALPACRQDTSAASLSTHRLRFIATLDGAAANCKSLAAPPFRLRDARLFVSELRVIGPDGETPAAFVPDSRFQSVEVALLDFEDATEGCEGDSAEHTELVFEAPVSSVRAVTFTVGIPFALNHQNPALARAPLTAGAMHWGWRGGYKFVRIEAQRDGVEGRIHLGSTGCEGALHAITSCAHPNRGTVHLELDPATQQVALDLGAFFGSDKGGDKTDCMGEPADPSCHAGYRAIGAAGKEAARQSDSLAANTTNPAMGASAFTVIRRTP